jgi:hypothetical protein
VFVESLVQQPASNDVAHRQMAMRSILFFIFEVLAAGWVGTNQAYGDITEAQGRSFKQPALARCPGPAVKDDPCAGRQSCIRINSATCHPGRF